jgi:hypothetical protein
MQIFRFILTLLLISAIALNRTSVLYIIVSDIHAGLAQLLERFLAKEEARS